MRSVVLSIVAVALATAASADFQPRAFNVFVGAGSSLKDWHGQASFRSVEFEILGRSHFIERWLPRTEAGVSATYSAIQQPRSWFGTKYGDPYDSVRGEWATLFLRHSWRERAALQPFVEIGSGPMWSNRRVPAATSRFNFNSHLGIGATVLAGQHPIYLMYRFSHISNLMFGDRNPGHGRRNPGWNVNSISVGMRFRKFGL